MDICWFYGQMDWILKHGPTYVDLSGLSQSFGNSELVKGACYFQFPISTKGAQ